MVEKKYPKIWEIYVCGLPFSGGGDLHNFIPLVPQIVGDVAPPPDPEHFGLFLNACRFLWLIKKYLNENLGKYFLTVSEKKSMWPFLQGRMGRVCISSSRTRPIFLMSYFIVSLRNADIQIKSQKYISECMNIYMILRFHEKR